MVLLQVPRALGLYFQATGRYGVCIDVCLRVEARGRRRHHVQGTQDSGKGTTYRF
jgi:hypothetical protein